MGVGVPVIYQRADGSAHVIAAVHAGDRDGHEVVDLLDPQKGEVAEKADVLAATKVWVIPVPEAEPDRAMVVLPPSGSGLRSQGWGSGLPIEVTGLKRQPGASRPEAGKTGPKGTTRTRGEIDERAEAGESSWAVVDQSSRRARQEVPAAAAGIDPGSPGNDESELLTPTDQPAQQDERSAQRKQKKKEISVRHRRVRRAEVDRVAELEELAGRGPLTEEQEVELAALQPREAHRKQQMKAKSARHRRVRRAEADRVAELEELAGRAPLTEEQEAELAALQPKVVQRKQQNTERAAKDYQTRKAAADRVAELEELAGRGPLTEEQEAELAALQPKAERRKQQTKKKNAKYYQTRKAAADRVAELEELAGRASLTEEQEAELAALQPKTAQRKQQKRERDARYRKVRKVAAAGAIASLEELEEQGPLTLDQQAELNLRREIEMGEKESARLSGRVTRLKEGAAEIEALEALPRSIEIESKLRTLRDKAAERADPAEQLKETRRRLAESRTKLKLMQEAGSGRIAGVVAGGQQDAMVLGEVGEWTGAGQGEQDAGPADVDLDEWHDRALWESDEHTADAVEGTEDAVEGAEDAGVMQGEDPAYEEFVATALTAFLRQDAGEGAADAGESGSGQ